jgi:hypothetical protein
MRYRPIFRGKARPFGRVLDVELFPRDISQDQKTKLESLYTTGQRALGCEPRKTTLRSLSAGVILFV